MKTTMPRRSVSIERSAPAWWKRFRLLREDRGDALVEMALCISLMGMPLLVGTVELGSLFHTSIEVSNAANAGAMYGMISSTFAANSSAIIAAAQAEASDLGTSLTVVPTVYYACSGSIGGTRYTTQSAASAACTSSSNHSLEFIRVVTSTSVSPPIRCPGLPSTFTLVGTSVMEVQE